MRIRCHERSLPKAVSLRDPLISNFRRVVNAVCFLLGNSPASEFCMPTFQNTICSIFIDRLTYLPMKMEQTECSETSAYKIQTPRNYPEEAHNFEISFKIAAEA
jgi:hypothetical protein